MRNRLFTSGPKSCGSSSSNRFFQPSMCWQCRIYITMLGMIRHSKSSLCAKKKIEIAHRLEAHQSRNVFYLSSASTSWYSPLIYIGPSRSKWLSGSGTIRLSRKAMNNQLCAMTRICNNSQLYVQTSTFLPPCVLYNSSACQITTAHFHL